MEIVSPEGSTTVIKPGQTHELGRNHGFNSSDMTISRRHVSLSIPDQETQSLQFEVLGRNPIYVSGNNEVKIFRRFERGEMREGDLFCASAKSPVVWYSVRRVGNGGEDVRRNACESELAGDLESGGVEDLEPESVDVSVVDPVKEFGFVVIGHEFDSYPKKMIRDIKDWEWFLEEARKDSDDDDGDDDDDGKKQKGSGRKKRKKGKENDDEEEWTGESDDDKALINKSAKTPGPKYVTRSKDRGKKDTRKSKSTTRTKKTREVDDEEVEDEDEDEEDETLGGFIVDDENLEEDEEMGEEEEEEEEELGDEDVEDE